MNVINSEEIKKLAINIRGEELLIDRDVALIYGVETKRINEAVKNNPERLPNGYIVEIEAEEKKQLVENFDRFEKLKHSSVNSKAFTEKGLYMLATILHSDNAIQTTLSIIETFSKIRELSRTVKELSVMEDQKDQKTLMQRRGELIAEILDDDLQSSEAETTIELNFAVLKFKHTIKKKSND